MVGDYFGDRLSSFLRIPICCVDWYENRFCCANADCGSQLLFSFGEGKHGDIAAVLFDQLNCLLDGAFFVWTNGEAQNAVSTC